MDDIRALRQIKVIEELFNEADNDYANANIIPLGPQLSKQGRELLSDVEGLLEMTEHYELVQPLLQSTVSYIAFTILRQQKD